MPDVMRNSQVKCIGRTTLTLLTPQVKSVWLQFTFFSRLVQTKRRWQMEHFGRRFVRGQKTFILVLAAAARINYAYIYSIYIYCYYYYYYYNYHYYSVVITLLPLLLRALGAYALRINVNKYCLRPASTSIRDDDDDEVACAFLRLRSRRAT